MASNPFFSGRIPQELHEKADEYCKQTGKRKTELLIEALSTYLNFPIATPATNFSLQPVEVTRQMFTALEERVKNLEDLMKASQISVITCDNSDNNNESIVSDAVAGLSPKKDTKSDSAALVSMRASEKSSAINLNNLVEPVINHEDSKRESGSLASGDPNFGTDLFSQPEPDDNVLEIIDNQSDNIPIQQEEQNISTAHQSNNQDAEIIAVNNSERPSFESILTNEVINRTNVSQRQGYRLAEKAEEKLKQQGKTIQPKKLLDIPIEVAYKNGITVDDFPYKLFYIGQNPRGKVLWNLVPDDKDFYQPVITKFGSDRSADDNTSHQHD
jgi:hypothetical protein